MRGEEFALVVDEAALRADGGVIHGALEQVLAGQRCGGVEWPPRAWDNERGAAAGTLIGRARVIPAVGRPFARRATCLARCDISVRSSGRHGMKNERRYLGRW